MVQNETKRSNPYEVMPKQNDKFNFFQGFTTQLLVP